MTEEKEPKNVKFIDLGKHTTCLVCHSRYCACIDRQDGTWENILPVEYHAGESEMKLDTYTPDDDWLCPKCGARGLWIDISIDEYSGRYCLKCYAKWIIKTFPKLEKKPKDSK